MTILSFNLHLSVISPQDFPSGSPLPVEMKVLKTGEIPVQMLRISQTLAIASKQGDGNGGELRPNDERGAFLLAPQVSEVKLLPRDGAVGDGFGGSVSIHGDYALVGAVGKDDFRGSAYIFRSDGSSWREQQMLFADDGRKGDAFGYASDIFGDFAVVGAINDDDKGEDTGSVYIFHRTGESWMQQAKLSPHGEATLWCRFGIDVAISGDFLVVGSVWEDSMGGAIYIFKRDGAVWNEQAKLKSSNWNQGDSFGNSVSISGDYVIATAPGHSNNTGSAYIFKRDGDTWKEQAILTTEDAKADDRFGASASISGDYAIVGARGAAYVFVREGASWKQQAKLIPDDFGGIISGVCISGEYVIVGALAAGDKGAIYGYMRRGDLWRQVSKRSASDGALGDRFGISVAFSGNYAIVGAEKADVSGEDSGAAYIYNYSEFFPVEPSGYSTTTFGGEKDRPALTNTIIPPPAN